MALPGHSDTLDGMARQVRKGRRGRPGGRTAPDPKGKWVPVEKLLKAGTPTKFLISTPRPRLANSPLAEVVFELKFPGSFAVWSGLERFQKAVQGDYPRLFVPPVQLGQHPALIPFRLSSQDDSRSINVALNLFSVMASSYGVFTEFRAEFERLFVEFRKMHNPPTLTRLGLRYINMLPVAPTISAAVLPNLHPWLEIKTEVPEGLRRPVSESSTVLVLEYPLGRMRVTIGNVQTEARSAAIAAAKAGSAFVVDLDFFREGKIESSEIGSFLENAHATIEQAFFDLVRPDVLAQLEGGGA